MSPASVIPGAKQNFVICHERYLRIELFLKIKIYVLLPHTVKEVADEKNMVGVVGRNHYEGKEFFWDPLSNLPRISVFLSIFLCFLNEEATYYSLRPTI